jgi:glycerol uptake facilitator protein
MTPTLRAIVIGEFLGTLLLVLLGDGVVATVELLGKEGGWIVITTGWGLAVTLGVYVSGRLSGGHLNPAVTLALVATRDVPARRIPAYCSAQFAGAFVGACLVYASYATAFAEFERKHHISRGDTETEAGTVRLSGPAAGGAGVFATYPAFPGLMGNLLSEFLGTAVLLFVVRALTDRRNASPGANLEPVLIGCVVWAIGLSLGGLTGYAINPARDFGPRLASYFLGWGDAVFRAFGYYFWVPIVAPLAGGVVGALLYDRGVRPHLSPPDGASPPGELSP